MPELPEVETIVRGLERTVQGKIIESIVVNSPKIQNSNSPGWIEILSGKKILGIKRRGKNILIGLTDNLILWIHLKMTGHLYYLPKADPTNKHDLMILYFQNDPNTLRFNDYRRFGNIRVIKAEDMATIKGLAELGPEPLEISRQDFVKLFHHSSRMIKPALLDQTFLAGIGNIYADESLYLAGIHPRKRTDTISSEKSGRLHYAIRKILNNAIDKMGTSVDSFAGVDGEPGGYQTYLKVYGREGLPCKRCGAKIRRERIGSRSAHFCPKCQRLR